MVENMSIFLKGLQTNTFPLVFKEILVKKKFLNIINKASNKGSVDKHLYKDWNDKEKKDYHYIIEKFFSHYDSLKTNL